MWFGAHIRMLPTHNFCQHSIDYQKACVLLGFDLFLPGFPFEYRPSKRFLAVSIAIGPP